jgi:hypothetical protein
LAQIQVQFSFRQCCGSGFNVSGSRSGSRRAKITHKNKNKKSRNFMFERLGDVNKFHVFGGAEGFSCNLNFLYGGVGMSKLQFLIQKI